MSRSPCIATIAPIAIWDCRRRLTNRRVMWPKAGKPRQHARLRRDHGRAADIAAVSAELSLRDPRAKSQAVGVLRQHPLVFDQAPSVQRRPWPLPNMPTRKSERLERAPAA